MLQTGKLSPYWSSSWVHSALNGVICQSKGATRVLTCRPWQTRQAWHLVPNRLKGPESIILSVLGHEAVRRSNLLETRTFRLHVTRCCRFCYGRPPIRLGPCRNLGMVCHGPCSLPVTPRPNPGGDAPLETDGGWWILRVIRPIGVSFKSWTLEKCNSSSCASRFCIVLEDKTFREDQCTCTA